MGSTIIPVRSERQAMDWSLVLASQDIHAIIDHSPENSWRLIVEPRDYGRAIRAIRQYHLENRGWHWQQHLPWSDITFHWGAVIWCFLLAFIYRLSVVEVPWFQTAARVDSAAILAGQWWRLFTAVLLHGDLAHLLANVTSGALFLGLAMARFGAAFGLLFSYLAGVAGNVAGLAIYRGPYQGLGASGMVMAGLGLISIQSIATWRASGDNSKQWLRAAVSGLMLFVLLGMDPSTDVIAHLGGFVFGALFGAGLIMIPESVRQEKTAQLACWAIFIGLLVSTVLLASGSSNWRNGLRPRVAAACCSSLAAGLSHVASPEKSNVQRVPTDPSLELLKHVALPDLPIQRDRATRQSGISLLRPGLWAASFRAATMPAPRCDFVGITNFSAFESRLDEVGRQLVLMSPEISSAVTWDELVVSWNVHESAALKVEARVIFPDRATAFYTLGLWSPDPARHPRESVAKQEDSDGKVETDTLVMNRRGGKVQIRMTLAGSAAMPPSKGQLKFVGISFLDSQTPAAASPAHKAAWGKSLPVPERSQLAYEGGEAWCSPTSTSMVLGFWAKALDRPDLIRDVPEVARAVYDRVWRGTGNWPFNTAFAGAFPGMRGYVTRLNDLSEIERAIGLGLPVIASVSYGTLKGTAPGASGHLVVCVGFTPEGDVVVNDPGTRMNVRRTFARERFVAAWAHSKNTVYFIYPETARPPSFRETGN